MEQDLDKCYYEIWIKYYLNLSIYCFFLTAKIS
jgi:hypothetical protein